MKPELHRQTVEFLQYMHPRPICERGAEPRLWKNVASYHDRDKYRRHNISKNHYAKLRNLSIGNAFHAT